MNHQPRGKNLGLAPAIQIWSAVPTPLTPALRVDAPSVRRLVGAALADGVTGLFLGGSCGEGPWLPDREQVRLIRTAADRARGRLTLAAQVTDHSVPRIRDNVARAADAGADLAIIAPPLLMDNPTPDRIAGFFTEAAAASLLPVGVYDLGRHRAFSLPDSHLRRIYELPNVVLVKDSSGSLERRALALAARRRRPGLRLFNGDEFRCVEYLAAGYDGCIFGGAAAVGAQLRRVVGEFSVGRRVEAERAAAEMNRLLFGIYGGPAFTCWLTGLKYCLVRRGLFRTTASFLGYPLNRSCRAFIDRLVARG
ncbi:MAG: dihydrodipicolinate synthase family protein [Opitutaceae bacterium]|nr:dihydrodipicolinate synthase family protein [Opitutaceae bacterium]